ncbi:MAG: cell surface protein SprA [Bacteroidetes bacterium]|nr:cell surface protein SprA [Bacteroidota bacterium]
MRTFLKYCFAAVVSVSLLMAVMSSNARVASPYHPLSATNYITAAIDSPSGGDSTPMPYGFQDQSGLDPLYFNNNNSPLKLKDPNNIKTNVTYDPDSNIYVVDQKLGNKLDYRPPTYMDFDEYAYYDLHNSIHEYWKQREHAESQNQVRGASKNLIPPIKINGKMADIFGGGTIDIRPQGSAELIFGININKTNNPALPERQRRISTFDFNEKIQLNVIGKIGEKLKLTTNYNTESTFEWENQMKLEFTGFDDDIIKKIEAGNVSFGLNTSLITGSQTLFGIKTQLQFGHLTATSIISQERGKKSEINVTGGAQTSPFEVSCDNYEANKHFFLSQYFYDHYDQALANFPVVNSGVFITRSEVWVTNRTGAVDNTRNIVAFADIGEPKPECENVGTGFIQDSAQYSTIEYPFNGHTTLYGTLVQSYPGIRDINSSIATTLAPLNASDGFSQSVNYEKINNARKLAATEYTLNPRLGYVSLNQALNYDEVVGVAYEYTVGGKTYKVGEFSTDGISGQNALIVKLLKSTNDVPKVFDPLVNAQKKYKLWDLMMKNIYSIGAYQVNSQNFNLQIWYNNPSTGTDIPFIPEGPINGKPLLQVENLDKLNQQQVAVPDGIFDFIDGVTINAANGRVIFPTVHPFGNHLFDEFSPDPNQGTLYSKYGYPQLYDSTKTIAQTVFAGKNRFKLKGTYQSASNSDISLNAVNIPQGSVVVTAGGAPLVENTDYTVDYTLGRVKIINESILNSGVPIKISLESNSLFNIQTKTLWGTHFDYRINKQFNIGATIMNLTERPVTQKINIGEEPMSNTIMGTDLSYSTDAPFLTRFVDHIPGIDTKAPSSISVNGEFAYLHPGHNKAIGKNGNSYIDDFEGTQSAIDIRSPQGWSLASVPQGQPQRFPEAIEDSTPSGFNRAKLCWYTIDPLFQRSDITNHPGYITDADMSDHRVRSVMETEVFPGKQPPSGQPMNISMLDLAYYPGERGPYNFDVAPSAHSAGLNANGELNNPATRWGGIMRRIETNDFEAANIEYIQIWMMDPYNEDVPVADQNTTGELCVDLGNISEDVLKDSRNSFENGLPTNGDLSLVNTTPWGRVPVVQSIVNAFDNNPDKRKLQDVGLDGLGDDDETNFDATYISQVQSLLGAGSQAAANAVKDPAGDNYHYYRGTDYDNNQTSILVRYKMFNGVDGNSPATGQKNDDGYSESYPTQSTTLPNQEDINRDNTLNETESYYEYRIKLNSTDINVNNVGNNFITDKWTTQVQTADHRTRTVTWYQFRIPIQDYTTKVGNIENFNSIRFIRVYFKDVDKPVICRMARLELVRSDWRKYNYSLLTPGEYISNGQSNTEFDLAAVNIEENGNKVPVNYVLPPGIDREQNVQSATLVRLNEQALSMKVCNLEDGDSRACYKTVNNMDVRSYKKIRMFVHCEQRAGSTQPLHDNDLVAFIRIGADQTDNYYEYDIPLKVTPAGNYSPNDETDRLKVWPEDNNLVLAFTLLQYVKQQRNIALANGTVSLTQEFTIEDPDNPGRMVTVKGNPNLSQIKVFMLGVKNPKKTSATPGDDGYTKCAELWFNELRLTDFDEHGGYAATARVNAKLADFAVVNLSGNMATPGFGSIEKKVSERLRENQLNYDVSAQVELGKFFNDKSGIRLPLFWGFGETFITPQYNPLDPDILLKPILGNEAIGKDVRDSIRSAAVDYTRRKSFNMTNIHKDRSKGKSQAGHFYDIENFTMSVAYTELYHHNVNIEYSELKNYRGGLTYAFNPQVKPWKPFDQAPWAKSKWMTIVREFNLNPAPSMLGFSTDLNRQFGEVKSRNITGFSDFVTPTSFNKSFVWMRSYDMRWDLSKNLKMDFSADNQANVLEPYGRLDTKEKRDTLLSNLKGFGTTMNYHHTFNASYAIPINKIPAFDWITPSVKYSAGYMWAKAPFSADSVGNTIGNNAKWDYTAQLNMNNLYNKVPALKKINAKKPGELNKKAPTANKPKPPTFKLPMTRADSLKLQAWKDSVDKANKNPYAVFEYVARILMSVKNVSGTYSVNSTMGLPGYGRRTQILGFDDKFEGPGLGFLFGQQNGFGPDKLDYPIYASQQGWLVHTQSLYTPFTKGTSQNLTMRATLEPYPDVKIELTANRTYSMNKSEFYHWNPNTGNWEIQSPTENGTFSISIITWHTAFMRESKSDHVSKVFEQFLNNRATISRRLGEANPNSGGVTNSGFFDGYSNIQQDVLIPAFIAAYTGHRAEGQSLNMFPQIPLPNWRITYDGLTKYPAIKKRFKTITLNHSYRSTYQLGGFQTNLDYYADADGFSSVRNVIDDFQSQFQITTVTIQEQFAPLAGIDMTWNNSLTTRLEYKKDRTLSLSLANTQLTEISGQEIVVGLGYRVPKLTLNFMKKVMRGKAPVSDLNMRADVSFRNNETIIRKAVEGVNVLTAGQNIFSIKTSIDYQLTTQLQIRFFCDRIMTNPLISSSFKTANTNAGISLRFMLQ